MIRWNFIVRLCQKKEADILSISDRPFAKKLNIKYGSTVKATFSMDNSKYQFDMPEELEEVLRTDPEANSIFHSLTKGNQRGLIYLVTQVKSSDKRIERALIIAERIKHGIVSPKMILK
jgi:hypothetical protein